MTRFLVTGASGFIGREVLNVLSRRGIETDAVSRRPPAAEERPGIAWHRADILQDDLSSLLEARRPTHLLHLAWEATPRVYRDSPANHDWAAASARLAQAFIKSGGKNFIFAGSCVSYALPAAFCDERETPLADDCAYAVCKAQTERDLAALMDAAGGRFAAGRIFYAYGPDEPAGKFIRHVCEGLSSGAPVPLSEGADVLDYVYKTDVAEAFVALALSAVGGAVNVGSGEAVTVRDIAARLGEISGRSDLLAFGKVPANRAPVRIVANIGRLTGEVGYRPAVSLDQGLRACHAFWHDRKP